MRKSNFFLILVCLIIIVFGCKDPVSSDKEDPGDPEVSGSYGSVKGLITASGLGDLSGCLVVVEKQIAGTPRPA